MKNDNCLICGSNKFTSILSEPKVPATLSTPSEGREEFFGALTIVMCQNCSHISNKDFDADIIAKVYAGEYSASLPLSPNIQKRFKNVAENVIGLEHIKNKTVVEVGASDFTFSENMINYGAKKVIAIEPSELFNNKNPKIVHVNDYATPQVIAKYFPQADTVVMRHVLEHVTNPVEMLIDFAKNLPVGAHAYIEVPNVVDIIDQDRPYEFFYEHINYFSPRLLKHMFESVGFEVVKVPLLINGQHFGVLGKKIRNPTVKKEQIKYTVDADLTSKLEKFKVNIKKFDDEFKKILKSHKKVAIYGAGGHAVSFITHLLLTPKDITFLLDQSPVKVGRLAPLSKIPIVCPTIEKVNEVDAIIIIASLHQEEIANDIVNKWKFKGSLYGTYPVISKIK